MFKHLFNHARTSTRCLIFVSCPLALLVLLASTSIRQPERQAAVLPAGEKLVHWEPSQKPWQTENGGEQRTPRQLAGAEALAYMQQPGEGQSLMQAVTAARFGLKKQERGPFGETGSGYLGMSHVQNLNAWFGEDGVTVRPSVSAEASEHSWHLAMQLKAYGYGNELVAAPPIVTQHVQDNRIEYERGDDFGLRIADFGSMQSALLLSPQSSISNPQLVEWYENRAEGIEQGFTINERPVRALGAAPMEPLRLVVSLSGDLRGRTAEAGKKIELLDVHAKAALSYGQLTAVDADGKLLAAHMAASAEGGEIALVIDDRSASYPIVIDPIVATWEGNLDPQFHSQAGAEFGDAVAIDGDHAIFGAWREDVPAVNGGSVYVFSRIGSAWILDGAFDGAQAGAECGYSVAITNGKAAYGCPGANNNTGRAFIYNIATATNTELIPSILYQSPGSFFGASIALSFSDVVAGAPLNDSPLGVDSGAISIFDVTGNFRSGVAYGLNNQLAGNGVAIYGDTILVGRPGYLGSGEVDILNKIDGTWSVGPSFRASDLQAGDLFGGSVALSGNTAVISAAGDNDKGTDAGAAYVFVRDAGGNWSQQQKLTANDGKANDQFSYFSVAILGNLIAIGARHQDGVSPNPNDNRGAAYIFTRNLNVWTQQTRLESPPFIGGPGDEFGTGVSISGDRVIVSAPHAASLNGTANAGTTHFYLLDCVPPSGYSVIIDDGIQDERPSLSVCPGSSVTFASQGNFALVRGTAPLTYQWRKNGVNIPGTNSPIYTINNVNSVAGGNYDVIVSNSCGGTVSSTATLVIHTFSLNPTSQNFSASGSNGILNVGSTGNCAWTATSNSSFITVTSGANGSGNGTVGFTVAANSGSSQRTGTITAAGQTFTVTQDGGVPTPTPTPTPTSIQLSNSLYVVGEADSRVNLTVTRSGNTSASASVSFATGDSAGAQNCNVFNGQASSRCDYSTAISTVQFAPGEISKTLSVAIVNDSYAEGNENFNVSLSSPAGASLGLQSTATIMIVDNESVTGPNPVDVSGFFVRQHYLDFLNREADTGGLNFWIGEIDGCFPKPQCTGIKRINVSAAFFLSIEFQQTGYLVERIYKTAYGNASGTSTLGGTHQLAVPNLRLTEFLPDTQGLGLGVVVGQTGWEQQLENNKQAFTAAFVQRTRFTTTFPASLTPAQFVDQLNTNAGGVLSTAERNQLVNDLSTNAKTRAQVVRAVAEDSDLNSAESNRAFVLMQFFGYLRRNPNDAPDSDYTGYDFWLGKLNQFNGNFVNAEMVKAFIDSAEYRRRFGP